MKKLKIMYVSQSNGGVSRYLQMFLKYLGKKEYQNILIFSKEHINEKDDFKDLADNIEFINMYRQISFFKDTKALFELYKVIKKYNPDIIYANSTKAGALVRILNIFLKRHVIYNAHGFAFNMRVSDLKRKLYIFVERFLAHFCDRIVAISEDEKKSALKYKICSSDKIDTIFNGIDIEKYKNLNLSKENIKENIGISKDSVVIGMCGRISDQKAPDTFVKAAYEIKKKIKNAFFIIVGDGELRDKIIDMIDKLNLEDSFYITGWVKDPYKYIEVFDIGMLLSRWEGFGLAAAEYMALNKPVIACNIGGLSDIIDNNKTGILVKVDDYIGAEKAAVKLIENKDFAQNLADSAKKEVKEKFDFKRVVDQHIKIFSQIEG